MADPWTIAEDALLGTMPDRIVAEKTGRPVAAVTRRRKQLSIRPWNRKPPITVCVKAEAEKPRVS